MGAGPRTTDSKASPMYAGSGSDLEAENMRKSTVAAPSAVDSNPHREATTVALTWWTAKRVAFETTAEGEISAALRIQNRRGLRWTSVST